MLLLTAELSLDEGVKISGLFIQEGPIVATQNKTLNQEINADTNTETAYAGPLIVLTSQCDERLRQWNLAANGIKRR